ncbi:MAG: F0F1 ATP synthase subunit B [Pseudomonadales bacterium]
MNINATMIGQMIFFFLFVAFCAKFVWPAIIGVMAEREKRIADGLENADKANRDLELAKQEAAQKLRQAKDDAAAIIEQANKRATQMVEEAKDQAREEGERLKQAAQAEIDREKNRAREELRKQVAALVLTGAERVLESSIDASKHAGMLDKLAAEL